MTAGEKDKPALDSVEEALVGSHQEEPETEDQRKSESDEDKGPPVPGHKSP